MQQAARASDYLGFLLGWFDWYDKTANIFQMLSYSQPMTT